MWSCQVVEPTSYTTSGTFKSWGQTDVSDVSVMKYCLYCLIGRKRVHSSGTQPIYINLNLHELICLANFVMSLLWFSQPVTLYNIQQIQSNINIQLKTTWHFSNVWLQTGKICLRQSTALHLRACIISNVVSLSVMLQGNPPRWRNIALRWSRVFKWFYKYYRWRWCYGNACHLHPLVAHEPG